VRILVILLFFGAAALAGEPVPFGAGASAPSAQTNATGAGAAAGNPAMPNGIPDSTLQQTGSAIYDSSGKTYQDIGGRIYGPNGETATPIGGTIYVDPGTSP
jgi:hypothetical protein